LLQIFNKVDANGDGMIDFQEFYAMMRAAEDEKAEKLEPHHSEARRATAPAAGARKEQISIGIGNAKLKHSDTEGDSPANDLMSMHKFSTIF